MPEKRIETDEAPHIHIPSCQGALTITGWPGTAVIAKGEAYTDEAPQMDRLTFTSDDDLTLNVPAQSRITVDTAVGPLVIKHVNGDLQIESAANRVTLNDVGAVQLKSAGADAAGSNLNGPFILSSGQGKISLRNSGDVDIAQAGGDVTLQFANGVVTLGEIAGDVALHTINGDVLLRQGRGSARLENLGGQTQVLAVADEIQLIGGLVNGEHLINGGADIFVAWPPDAPVTLMATAVRIDNHLSALMNPREATQDGLTTLTGHIENGKAYLTLKTPKRIGLISFSGEQTPVLNSAVFDHAPPPLPLEELVRTAVHDNLPDANAQEIERVADAVYQRLLSQAPQTDPSASQSPLQTAKKRLVRLAKQTGELPPLPPKPAAPTQPKELVVRPSQEQVLHLLKDGRITVEQANILLNTLKDEG